MKRILTFPYQKVWHIKYKILSYIAVEKIHDIAIHPVLEIHPALEQETCSAHYKSDLFDLASVTAQRLDEKNFDIYLIS